MNRFQAIFGVLIAVSLLICSAYPPVFAQGGPSTRSRDTRTRGGGEGQSFPAQSAVAAKTGFSTVSASSGEVKRAVKATDLAGATKLVGKNGSFTGTVSQVYSPSDHDIAILDFAQNYRSALTAIVKPANYAKLPNIDGLAGKTVLVSGKFIAYEGKPEIEITSPAQVKIVK